MKLFLLTLIFPSLVFAKTIKIAVIDSGLDEVQTIGLKLCKDGMQDFTATSMTSEIGGHGNNVSHIIGDGLLLEDYCMYHFKAFSDNKHAKIGVNSAIAMAINMKVDIINYSAGGITSFIWEEAIIELALKRGIIFVAAAGNNSENLDKNCDYFPGCYVGVKMVGNLKNKLSNYGKVIKIWRNGNCINAGNVTMSGTSQATAIYSRELLLKLIKEQK